MIRKASERTTEVHARKFGGNGSIFVRSLTNSPEELNGKGRVFAHTTLQPGCSIGYHVHENESELYYIYSGSGEFDDDGTIVPIEAGDVTITPSGCGHAIRNTGKEPLEFIALILYA